MSSRPAVSVIIPFYGGGEEAAQVVAALARLELSEGDELIVADNTPEGVVTQVSAKGVTRVAAGDVQSSYFARNAGADAATNDWLLFIDADCTPSRGLLDEYFRTPIDPRAGAVAGEVVGSSGQTSLAARYSASRRHIGQAEIQDHPYRPMAVTANLLVRRAVWDELGGFHEGVRSGGDADFSWRLQDAGYTLGYVPDAVVEHRHRETVAALLRQSARYGAGMRWLARRHPEARFHGRARALARSVAGVLAWTVTGRFERALFKGLDGGWTIANALGSLASNVHGSAPHGLRGHTAIIVERFPDPADRRPTGLARALSAPTQSTAVHAAARVDRPDRAAARGILVFYREDDGPVRRLADMAWLVARHPFRSARDLVGRSSESRPLRLLAPSARRLSRYGAAAISTLPGDAASPDGHRLGRLLGVPVSETEPAGALGAAAPVAS